MSEQRVDTAKEKIHRVFSYIRELTKLRTPPISEVSTYDWSVRFSALPSYPTIQTSQILDQSEEEFDGVILRVKRPKETPCPTPPTSLRDWLENGWDKVEGSCSCIPAKNLKDSKGNTHTEKFDDDPKRLDDFAAWSEKRSAWQTAERPVREAAEVFASFFQASGATAKRVRKISTLPRRWSFCLE